MSGYCAQFYPSANCQNRDLTVPLPATISCVPRFAELMRGGPVPVRWAPSKHVGRGGRRYACD
jgi:hypothetical protein